MTTTRLSIGGIQLIVDYHKPTNPATNQPFENVVAVESVSTPDGIDNIMRLLSVDCLSTIHAACVRHAREESAYLARCQEQEALEP